jgi:hypothetical protein
MFPVFVKGVPEEQLEQCGKPAVEFNEDDEGKRWYYCAEHWDKRERIRFMLRQRGFHV